MRIVPHSYDAIAFISRFVSQSNDSILYLMEKLWCRKCSRLAEQPRNESRPIGCLIDFSRNPSRAINLLIIAGLLAFPVKYIYIYIYYIHGVREFGW